MQQDHGASAGRAEVIRAGVKGAENGQPFCAGEIRDRIEIHPRQTGGSRTDRQALRADNAACTLIGEEL